MDQTEFKRYAISSLYTFVAGFLLAIMPVLDSIDFSNMGRAAIFGLIGAGVRGGIKMLGESFLVWRDKKKD